MKFNPTRVKRDDFKDQQLSAMEEYYLTEIEQQCFADQMTKLIKDERVIKNQLDNLQKRHQESMDKKMKNQKDRSSQEVSKRLSNEVNLSKKQSSDKAKVSELSCESHEKELKMHKIKLLMMHETRKNFFVFSIHKDAYRRLSDLDIFNDEIPGTDGPINSKNFKKKLFSLP